MKKILIVDDDPGYATLLREVLGSRYDVATAADGAEALLQCQKGAFDLILSDIRMPGMEGPSLIQEIRRILPSVRSMLMTSYNVDQYVSAAKQFGIGSIMPKTLPPDFEMLHVVVDGLLTDSIFGLRRYLGADGTIIGSYSIRTSEEGRRIREQVVEMFAAMFGSARDLNLVLDEAITNAIYHAPQLPQGGEKYRELTEVSLQPAEYVGLQCGRNGTKYGVSIVDQQGTLTKDTVLGRISRHVAGEGILDESGRGIHLARMFADIMVINIQPGVKTEVVLMNYILDGSRGSKPLYVNVVAGR